MKKLLFVTLFLAFLSTANSRSTFTKTFNNTNCKQTKSCDLVKLQIKVTRTNDNKFSQTMMEGFYETTSTDLVEKYAIVQFIKGSLQRTILLDDVLTHQFYRKRNFFGDDRFEFNHPEWVVDSFDSDPIYASSVEQNHRHASYKIKVDERYSLLTDPSKYYTYYLFNPEMKVPRMHFSDLPSGGSISDVLIGAGPDQGKRSIDYSESSMEFKTCVYKTEDVPINAGPSEINIKNAIGCLEWSNLHFYDPVTKTFSENRN